MAAMRTQKQNKPRGHYCKVCGEHKANERFSGKGHAAHICQKCAAMPLDERNAQIALRKIDGMAFRHLDESEIKWLRGKMNDPRPDIREAACEAHNMKFPRYERNMVKKSLTAFSLELFIHGEVWSEWGDEVTVHMLVTMDDTGVIRRVDYDAPENERDTTTAIDAKEARAFLKSLIHEYDALFWDEDLSDAEPGGHDPYLDILPEYRPDDNDADDDETAEPSGNREPIWSLCLELNNGEEKKITFYYQMHDAPQELFRSLMEWFEPDDEDESDIDETGE